VFADQARSLFEIDVFNTWVHLAWVLIGFWVAGSIFSAGLALESPPELDAELPDRRRLAPIELGIILGSVSLLFALFVLIQVRYLFGGEDAVQRSLDLTYAEYARRGFFELVIASLLLLPVLYGMEWSRRKEQTATVVFGALAFVLVALLSVIIASAWQRLSIYVDAFGLTELRLYAVAALPWLGAALIWFLICVARGRREAFFPGAALAALITVIVLNAFSPDALIARVNTHRATSGHSFDAAYAASLSADAVPILVRRLESLEPADRCQTAAMLLSKWARRDNDPRSWNYARWKATRLVSEHTVQLKAACL
jgi:hypothetical protein